MVRGPGTHCAGAIGIAVRHLADCKLRATHRHRLVALVAASWPTACALARAGAARSQRSVAPSLLLATSLYRSGLAVGHPSVVDRGASAVDWNRMDQLAAPGRRSASAGPRVDVGS